MIGSIASVAACTQAIAGAGLISRFVGDGDPLTGDGQILRFMLLGGPVACVIAPTVGATTLLMRGVITADDFWSSWGTWWIGDAIGVLIFTPLVMTLIAEPRSIWKARRNYVAYPLALLFSLVIIVF